MTNTLGTRRLIGWLAAISAVLVVTGYATWPQWSGFVGQLMGSLGS
jgi:hypothetical protein